VIFGYSSLYSADDIELALPDAAAAKQLLSAKRPDITERLRLRINSVSDSAFSGYLDAALLGTARLGLRHGALGTDFLHYHNEDHVMDLAERRIGHMLDVLGRDALPAEDWLTLVIFAACHDLRQRETRDADGPVGGNEAASVAETFRILDACGFQTGSHRSLYAALELMIAGSTFDPRLPENNAGTVNLTGGSLARSLGLWLDSTQSSWRTDPDLRRGERLARISADIDTANVGEKFQFLGQSALQLCEEMLKRRDLNPGTREAAEFSAHFLSLGQLHYFFDLHRFSSREGERVFGPQKQANSEKVSSASQQLQSQMQQQPAKDAHAVMKAYQDICLLLN
jgi:hypothetical protein